MTQRTVNLDSIFPKEIVERTEYHGAWDNKDNASEEPCDTPKAALASYLNTLDAHDIAFCKPWAVYIGAFNGERVGEISRVRIRLSLQINIIKEQIYVWLSTCLG